MTTFHLLDVENQDSIEKAKDLVQSTVQDEGLNLLVNNAGILARVGLFDVTREDMRKHYEVNCIGPLMMAKVNFDSILVRNDTRTA